MGFLCPYLTVVQLYKENAGNPLSDSYWLTEVKEKGTSPFKKKRQKKKEDKSTF